MKMIIIFMFIIGNLIFVSKYKPFLIVFLSLEFLVLIIFCFLFYFLSYYLYENFMLILYLVFSVCEGVLGLSVLVSLVRSYGNDYFQSFNLLN
uniref:NADH-ubiquinone oxidoreductase chain 4L n=1 Tax=Leucoptera malifoliella TaxID=753488 RepID=J7EZT5_9NEOP|nr:NADH dehydrogenase subunit 4L [Leucoptera malifoliella]AER38735.1 NADH dehydrogenase subunit 4L [Leucoptera malifoliella]